MNFASSLRRLSATLALAASALTLIATPNIASAQELLTAPLEADVVNSANPPFFTFDIGGAEFTGTFVAGSYTFQLTGTQEGLDVQFYNPPLTSPGAIAFTAFDGVTAVAGGNILLDPGMSTFSQTLSFTAATAFDKITLDGTFVGDSNAQVSRVVLESAALTTVTAVPEASSWAMMFAGLVVVGGVARGRKAKGNQLSGWGQVKG